MSANAGGWMRHPRSENPEPPTLDCNIWIVHRVIVHAYISGLPVGKWSSSWPNARCGRAKGIEAAAAPGSPSRTIGLRQGGLATSGDSRRFLLANGTRYSHILDARTGWPVPDAPRSVTVLGGTCTQAGAFSTLAILQGANARQFLIGQGVQFWIQ